MSLPSFSVNNRVFVNMCMVVILVAGVLFAMSLVREMFPESRPDKLAIIAVYPGVQPQEIEKAVTIKVEEAIRDVEGVEKVESNVREGFSSTFLTLLNEVDDVDSVLQEVKNDVDAIEDIPEELEKITIEKIEPQLPVISVALYGEGDEAALKEAGRQLRDDLLALPGISDVELNGTRDDEISVEVRPERLLEYNVTFEEVAQAIRSTNLDVSGGELKGARSTVAVRTLGEETRGRDLGDIVVRAEADGRKILLSDVAFVRDGFVDTDLESRFNAKPSITCVVYKTKTQDAIQISRLVKAYIAGKRGESFDAYGFEAAKTAVWYARPFAFLGAAASRASSAFKGGGDPATVYDESRRTTFRHNYAVALHSDLARFVEGRLDLMTRNGRTGLLLVLVSLMLFLNWRVAFWAAVGLPVSFMGTFVVMWLLGASINLLSLFGLIIVLGIIVDDAIVIGENIYRHVEEGEEPKKAAVAGAEEVMFPVTIAVLTTIAAFAPLFFVKGQIGDFMHQLPLVVLAALSVSLIEALVILPAHLAELPAHKSGEEPSEESAGPRRGLLRRLLAGRWRQKLIGSHLPAVYERFLRSCLKWRYVTVAAALATLMLAFGLKKGGIVEDVFIQKMDSETLMCALEMPVGTTADVVRERLETISESVVESPEVVNVQAFVARQYDIAGAGATGTTDQSHLGQLIVELHPADYRESHDQRSSEELLTEFRRLTGALAGVNSVAWEAMSGGPGGKAIEIRITGKDFEHLVAVSDALKRELRTYEGVYDLDDDHDRGKREVQLRMRESARPTGISEAALGRHVRAATYGHEARRMTRNREDVRIMVRYPESFRSDPYHIETMWIPTDGPPESRGWVPLGEVARLEESEGISAIHRSDLARSVTVFGEVDQETANSAEILGKIRTHFETELAPAYPGTRIEFLGSFEERRKAFGGLKIAFPVALLLIYVMLAGLFRSYFQPLVVMAAIPFGIEGAIVGHWVTGYPFTILSWIGLVALTGILVNDALVLVDFINSRVRRGMSHFEASIEGARLRLRAILLTTLTTVAGLTPLMFETSFQAKFLIPMAVTLTFGLAFATVLTLIIVPSLNMIFYDVAACVRRYRQRAKAGLPEAALEAEAAEAAGS